MGKEYKPKYKLIIKYPRLPLKFESGDIVYYNALSKAYVREKFPHYAVDVNEVENNPDFWEEVKQPLFITEDGVEYTHLSQQVWGVSERFEKRTYWVSQIKGTKVKAFYNESNADEYIWRNKPLFSYQDMGHFINENIDNLPLSNRMAEALRGLAKKKSEQ